METHIAQDGAASNVDQFPFLHLYKLLETKRFILNVDTLHKLEVYDISGRYSVDHEFPRYLLSLLNSINKLDVLVIVTIVIAKNCAI